MLRFKSFIIIEASLAGRGSEAERHAKKYITPFIGSNEPTHTISSRSGNLEAGQRVHVHGHEVDKNGRHHAIVSTTGNEKDVVKLPFSRLSKPKSGYSDEHAIVRLWNHSVANKKHDSIKSLTSEIEAAEKDKDHPLSFETADSEGFLSRDKNATGAREVYFAELRRAAHTVKSLSDNPDIQKRIKSGDFAMERIGSKRGTLSQAYIKGGVKQESPASTSKTDLTIGTQNPLRLTVKNSRSSQLTSSGSSDFMSMARHAANKLREHGHIDDEKHNQIISAASEISKLQKKGTQQYTDEVHQNNLNQGKQNLRDLASIHPKFNEYFRREALTGEGKFDSELHKPTHIVTHGEGSTVIGINDHDYSGSLPRISRGKGGSGKQREYVIRVDAQ